MTAITNADDPVLRICTGEARPELRAAVAGSDVTAVEVGSTGVPALEPLVVVTRADRSTFHARCSPERLADEVVPGVAGEDDLADVADAVAAHDRETTELPLPDLGGLNVGVRRILGGAGWRRPGAPADHAAAGGFVDADPETVIDVAGRLRGRGWGDRCRDEPLAGRWETARATEGDVAVVVNAHGSTADALLLSSVPFEVLEGAESAAEAVDADRIVVYASREDDGAFERVREAIREYPDPSAAVDVVEGPPAYRAAEPTMALEAVEGNHRLEARLRPPGPEEFGLDGRPTLVHTARTFAHLAVALRDDAPAGTRVVTVSGDVAAPATVELPASGVLATALDAVDVDGRFKAACVGGRFGGIASSLDVAPEPEALAAAGLGTEGTVEVLADDRCVVGFVGARTRFAAEANCGRCVPCREGTTQLVALLREIYEGDYRADEIEELVGVMDTSICAFGVEAGRPARTAMAEFEPEFEAHAEGRCPTGSCAEPHGASG